MSRRWTQSTHLSRTYLSHRVLNSYSYQDKSPRNHTQCTLSRDASPRIYRIASYCMVTTNRTSSRNHTQVYNDALPLSLAPFHQHVESSSLGKPQVSRAISNEILRRSIRSFKLSIMYCNRKHLNTYINSTATSSNYLPTVLSFRTTFTLSTSFFINTISTESTM